MPFPARRLGGESARDAERRARDSELDAIRQSISGGGGGSGTFTSAMETKLNGIEDGATADQTGAEILTALGTPPFYSWFCSGVVTPGGAEILGRGSTAGNQIQTVSLSRNGVSVEQKHDIIYNQDNNNPGVFLIQTAGLYRIHARWTFKLNGSERYIEVGILVNRTQRTNLDDNDGTTFNNVASLTQAEGNETWQESNIERVLLLSANDTIEFKYYSSAQDNNISYERVHGSISMIR